LFCNSPHTEARSRNRRKSAHVSGDSASELIANRKTQAALANPRHAALGAILRGGSVDIDFYFHDFRPAAVQGSTRELEKSWCRRLGESPWSNTIEVYVGTPARFFINGEEVKRSELGPKLTEQLGRRAEWTVYFEADPDTLFMDDAYALDTIQACGARVVWVTPKMREEWQQNPKKGREATRSKNWTNFSANSRLRRLTEKVGTGNPQKDPIPVVGRLASLFASYYSEH
jgi:hypothetical protein